MRPESSSEPSRLPPGWLDRPVTRSLVLGELAARRRRRTRRYRLVAATAAVALLGVFAAWQWRPAPTATSAIASLAAPAREILPDGSIVVRRGPAEISVRYDGTARHVMLTRGTAHFDVIRDPARPFIVTAGGVTVRAVGTAFSVGVQSAGVEVLVTEGRVAVAEAEAEVVPPALVEAGHGVIVAHRAASPNAARAVRAVPSADLEARLAWRVRVLDFSQTPLDVVLRQLNAYNRVQFALGDPALAGVRLSGRIRADRIDSVIQLLEQDCGVRAERVDDATILLRRR